MRPLFTRIKGRIRSMEAPVVPIIFAITAPMSRMAELTPGVPFLSTFIMIPPEATNKPVNNAINWTYSNVACIGPCVLCNTNK